MCTVILVYALAAASLLEFVDAHGVHHPIARDEDSSFDNIVEQKYPTLSSLDPIFVAEYRRSLAVDLTHNSENSSAVCDPECYFDQNQKTSLSCDDLVRHL